MTLTEIRDDLAIARKALLAFQAAMPENPAMLQKAGRACMAVTALHAYLGNRLDPYAGTIGRNDHGPSD